VLRIEQIITTMKKNHNNNKTRTKNKKNKNKKRARKGKNSQWQKYGKNNNAAAQSLFDTATIKKLLSKNQKCK
jgi:hypothetical protein